MLRFFNARRIARTRSAWPSSSGTSLRLSRRGLQQSQLHRRTALARAAAGRQKSKKTAPTIFAGVRHARTIGAHSGVAQNRKSHLGQLGKPAPARIFPGSCRKDKTRAPRPACRPLPARKNLISIRPLHSRARLPRELPSRVAAAPC